MSNKKTSLVAEEVPFYYNKYVQEKRRELLELPSEERFGVLQAELGLFNDEWLGVLAAASDAHLDVRAYCRLMVLCAAGFGGVAEHVERAIGASFDADKAPGIKVTVKSRKRR